MWSIQEKIEQWVEKFTKILSCEREGDSVGIRYSQSGTYRPYNNEIYTVVSTSTTALEEDMGMASAKEVNMIQE